MNIAVIGGAGYIGAHIVDLLCSKGYDTYVFDNLSTGFKENLNKKAIFFKGDILSNKDLNYFFENQQIDAVIHMAGLKSVRDSMSNPSLYSQINIIGSINLISVLMKFKIKKIIFSSSAAVYGEPLYNPIDERHSTKPTNHYGYTKLFIENYLSWISKHSDLKFIALRYFNAAGYDFKNNLIKFKEKNPQNLIPIVMEVANGSRKNLQIFGNNYNTYDGTCIRDYIHVSDLATAHIKALEYIKHGKSCSINLSTSKGYSVLDVINISRSVTGKEIKFIFSKKRLGDPETLVSDNKIANNKLKWVPVQSDLKNIITSIWRKYK